MLRFRRMKSLQKFASVHANAHHFNLERHLIDREGSVRANAPIIRRGGVGRSTCPVPASLRARFATSIHRPR
jgi:hypothetical protein